MDKKGHISSVESSTANRRSEAPFTKMTQFEIIHLPLDTPGLKVEASQQRPNQPLLSGEYPARHVKEEQLAMVRDIVKKSRVVRHTTVCLR